MKSKRLFATIRKLKSQGVSIVYISHRLEELFEVGDRVTVMREPESFPPKKQHRKKFFTGPDKLGVELIVQSAEREVDVEKQDADY